MQRRFFSHRTIRRTAALGLLAQGLLLGSGGCFNQQLIVSAVGESLAFTLTSALQSILSGLLTGGA